MTDSQYGFSPQHFTETVLTGVVDEWSKNIDKEKLSGVFFRSK